MRPSTPQSGAAPAAWLCPACVSGAPLQHTLLTSPTAQSLIQQFQQPPPPPSHHGVSHTQSPVTAQSFTRAHVIIVRDSVQLRRALELFTRDWPMSELNRDCQRQEFDESLARFVRLHHTNRTPNMPVNLTVNAAVTHTGGHVSHLSVSSVSPNNEAEVSQVVIHADESEHEHEDALTPMPIIHSGSFSGNTPHTATVFHSSNTYTVSHASSSSSSSAQQPAVRVNPPAVPTAVQTAAGSAAISTDSNSTGTSTSSTVSSAATTNVSSVVTSNGSTSAHSGIMNQTPVKASHSHVPSVNQSVSTPIQPAIQRSTSERYEHAVTVITDSPINENDDSGVTVITLSDNDSPATNMRSPFSAPAIAPTSANATPASVTPNSSMIVGMSRRASKMPPYYSATMHIPTQSRANSEPAKSRTSREHQSRYSIVGLPRPRRLASESNPAVSATLQSRTISANTRVPSSSHPVKSPISHSSHSHGANRKSWSVRELWVNREQQELKIEEEKYKLRIKQLTKALNVCRLIQPRQELSVDEVDTIVKRLKIDLSKLDVGHITTMEHERLTFTDCYTLLATLQLLSTNNTTESVGQRLQALSVSGDVTEYVLFFFPDSQSLTNVSGDVRPSNYSRHDAYHSHRKSLSQHHTNVNAATVSMTQSPLQQPHTLPQPSSSRDILSVLTAYINRRQTEDRIRIDQLDSYAKQVKFDLAKVSVSDAEAVLGRAHSSIELAAPSATGTDTRANVARKVSLPHLHSANQVVIALQMLYEDVAYEDHQVMEICQKAHMQSDTINYLLAKNKEKQKRMMEEDRAKRRKKRMEQRNERVQQSINSGVNGNGMTIKELCTAINANHLCLNWAHDEDELQAAFKSVPQCDLRSINISMVNELAVKQFKFSSPTQLAHTLHLLSAPDVSIQQIQHLCTETALPPAIVRHIVTARLKFELLDDSAITVAEEEDERRVNEARSQQSKQKAANVMSVELQEDDSNDHSPRGMTITNHTHANTAKSVTITELVDSLNSAQLVHNSIVMTPTMVTELLDQHPFPLSIVDLSEIHSMRQARLTFDSPKQLFTALELLHSEMLDEEVRIEAVNSAMNPNVVRYIMEHDRPIHAQVNISREDSRASRSRTHGKRGLSRHSISLVQTLEGGQEFVEEFVQAASIADFISGTTTSQQLAYVVRQAHLVEVDNDTYDAATIEQCASDLEFDYSVVDLEMIPILARHTTPFRSLPQLLTALQLLYTDLSDEEIKLECEAVKMDRKTSKFLVKNSLRKLLSQPDISVKLTDVGGGADSGGGSSKDPRYVRVLQVDDESGMEELVELVTSDTALITADPRTKKKHRRARAYFTSAAQLAHLVQQLDLIDVSAASYTVTSHTHTVIELSHALRVESVNLNEVKLTDLARFAEHGIKFASMTQVVSALSLIHSELSSDEIRFEAKRRNLPETVVSHLMEFHSEDHDNNKIDFQPLTDDDRKRWRSRHQTRYISQDLRFEEWSEELMAEPLTISERRRNTAVAVYAKLQSCDSMLESGVSATQAEIESWMAKLNVDSDWVQIEALDLVQMQITAGLEHKLMSVRDLIVAVVDAGDQASVIAENEGISVESFVEKVKSGEHELPVPTKPSERKLHNRSASVPASRRTSDRWLSNNGTQLLQSIAANGSASPSPLSSQNHTPSANDSRRIRGHNRGAHSVSWTREPALEAGLKDKRETQLSQLRRIIAQNQLVVGSVVNASNTTPTPTPRTSQPVNSDEPPPPLLLSERRSLGHSAPQSPTSPTSQQPMLGSINNSPIHSVRPPPLPPGFSLRINTQAPQLAQSPSSAALAPVPLTVVELETAYQWDQIVDPVYSIHLVCDLIKWRAVNDPMLSFPSVTAMFDFLNSPHCPVFDNEDEMDPNNPLLMTGGNDNNAIDRSVTQSVKSLASRLAPQIRPQLPSLSTQPPQAAFEIDSASPSPPPIPPSVFAPPPFSPTVALSINHPYAFPSIEAMTQAKERQLSLGDGELSGAPVDPSATVCCSPMFGAPKPRPLPVNGVNGAPPNQPQACCVIL